MGEVSFGSIHYHSLFWIGLALLAVTFILNIIAQRVLVRYGMMK
jgi:ABC-type phosphate transport system permease subunit